MNVERLSARDSHIAALRARARTGTLADREAALLDRLERRQADCWQRLPDRIALVRARQRMLLAEQQRGIACSLRRCDVRAQLTAAHDRLAGLLNYAAAIGLSIADAREGER